MVFLIIVLSGIIIAFIIVSILNRLTNNSLKQKNDALLKEYEELFDENSDLKLENNNLSNLNSSLKFEKEKLEYEAKGVKQWIDNGIKQLENQKQLSRDAYESYFSHIEDLYKEKEEEWDRLTDAMECAYASKQISLIREIESYEQELDKIRQTRAAAIEAQRKEKEILEQSNFYCLQIQENDLKDEGVLNSIKPKLNNPRILSMLIWQTYYRTPMNNLCNNVIGKTVKTGIYKITNKETKECYIGQAVDLASRWKDHAKCGLGIDTPVGNKLYKAMQEYGLYSFSWEVLEECPKEQLDEKEKFYIDLYQSKQYGYNLQRGNK